MFSQQVPRIMDYFFFKLGINRHYCFKGSEGYCCQDLLCFCPTFFLFYYLDFVLYNQMVWVCLPSYLPPHHLRFIIISVTVNGLKNANRSWEIKKCEFINLFLISFYLSFSDHTICISLDVLLHMFPIWGKQRLCVCVCHLLELHYWNFRAGKFPVFKILNLLNDRSNTFDIIWEMYNLPAARKIWLKLLLLQENLKLWVEKGIVQILLMEL